MIKKLDSVETPKTARRGFQHVSEVVERLIRMYELRAEMNEQRRLDNQVLSTRSENEMVAVGETPVQATFGWE